MGLNRMVVKVCAYRGSYEQRCDEERRRKELEEERKLDFARWVGEGQSFHCPIDGSKIEIFGDGYEICGVCNAHYHIESRKDLDTIEEQAGRHASTFETDIVSAKRRIKGLLSSVGKEEKELSKLEKLVAKAKEKGLL